MSKATRLARAKAAAPSIDFTEPGTTSPPAAGTPEHLAFKAARYDDLLRDLRLLATRDDGWLRLIPSSDTQEVHLKWKYTRGRWEGYYVYVRVEDMRVNVGLQLLLRKLDEVAMTVRTPTKDKSYEAD